MHFRLYLKRYLIDYIDDLFERANLANWYMYLELFHDENFFWNAKWEYNHRPDFG